MGMDIVFMVARWEGVGGTGCRGEGIKKYKQVVTEQPWGYKVQYRKWSSQRIYMHDPSMDMNKLQR